MKAYTRHPDGPPCLVCHTRTWFEGQLCPACVEKGHRVENDTLIMNLNLYVETKPGEHWSLVQPIANSTEDR